MKDKQMIEASIIIAIELVIAFIAGFIMYKFTT